MLYDGAIAALQRAAAAIEAGDIQKKCAHLNRALAIIAQLEGTLNFERGGEVARTLKTLYVYARAQALKANIENSPEILRSLIEKLSTVREAWYEADRRPSTSATIPASQGSPQEALYEAPHMQQFSFSAPPNEESLRAPSPPPERGSWRMSA